MAKKEAAVVETVEEVVEAPVVEEVVEAPALAADLDDRGNARVDFATGLPVGTEI